MPLATIGIACTLAVCAVSASAQPPALPPAPAPSPSAASDAAPGAKTASAAEAQSADPTPADDKGPSTGAPADEATGKTSTPASTPTIRKEVVTGGRLTDTEERRYSTATKMVFGREELDRYGDTNLADVLKRLPGITISGAPGRGGDIRMRGLGRGYTLILINGEPMPRGFSLDTLAPDQVERIEVLRAPVAENSARAIAGTINIILREEIAKKENSAVPSVGVRNGRLQPYITLQRNDTAAGNLTYNLTATGGHSDNVNESRTETNAFDRATGTPLLSQIQQDRAASQGESVNVNGRFNWKLDGGDNFTLVPFVLANRSRSNVSTTLEQPFGLVPPPYNTAETSGQSDITTGRVFGNWRLRLAEGARLELRFNTGAARSDVEAGTAQFNAAGFPAHTIQVSTNIHDASASTSGKYSRPLGKGHQFGAGWELEGGRRSERSSDVIDGIDPLAQYGDIEANTRRMAAYAQDEWDITPLWGVYGGVRWETIRTSSTSAIDAVSNRSTVASPLFHSVWRFDPESKDQVRLAVTRTYRTPTLGNLVAVPTLSQSYPPNGPNTPTNADTVGNPDLKPELAWGIDLAIEHYFPAGGLVSASVFRRSIEDLIRNVTALEDVPWSPVQRWVSRPRNIGHATSQGVELEAKVRLDELMEDWPRINVRANYSRYWSKVDDIPGPDNRLDQQPTWTANVGADYRMTALPLSFGGNLTLTPSFVVQQAVNQQYFQGRKRSADIYAQWRFTPNVDLRISAANLYAADYVTATRETFDSADQTATNTARTYRWYGARLEVKF